MAMHHLLAPNHVYTSILKSIINITLTLLFCVCRVVVFIDLLSELIESATTKYNSLSDSEKMETAIYLIPEASIANFLPLVSTSWRIWTDWWWLMCGCYLGNISI